MKLHRIGIWLALLAAPLGAQGFRISGTTTVDYVDVQPLVMDSVLASSTSDSGLLRTTPDGIIVECVGADAYCRYYRSANRVSTGPLMQDLELSGWGLGTGISVYAHGRVRTSIGSASEIWPFSTCRIRHIRSPTSRAPTTVRGGAPGSSATSASWTTARTC